LGQNAYPSHKDIPLYDLITLFTCTKMKRFPGMVQNIILSTFHEKMFSSEKQMEDTFRRLRKETCMHAL
jgi:hypothetical protein